MKPQITASMLYNYVQCPHRVFLDIYGDPGLREPVSVFVKLLWERGSAFEQETIEKLKIPFTNLRIYAAQERERLTWEAIRRGDDLIYGGRIEAGNLLGEPDLLKRIGERYIAGDIKSGTGFEGGTGEFEGKPKKHYAVQLAFYTEILERLGLSACRRPFIWDIQGNEIVYNLDGTAAELWNFYRICLDDVSLISTREEPTLPALSSVCKLCHWRRVCRQQLEKSNDLTLIPELGRSRRDAMLSTVKTVTGLAFCDIEDFIQGNQTLFPRVGPGMLARFQARAKLLVQKGATPYLREELYLPSAETELFFDVETDPMRDVCYLHGFVERRNTDNRSEQYIPFFADEPTPGSEQKAFQEAWAYTQRCRPCVIYYYSPYERTIWRKLRKRYPMVMTEAALERLFSPPGVIDLYSDVVKPKTEWPTNNYSIKTLATYLGFKWRDTEPSGAASIEWYNRWVETGDGAIKNRILDYNEDDCVATRVLLDGIRQFNLKNVAGLANNPRERR